MAISSPNLTISRTLKSFLPSTSHFQIFAKIHLKFTTKAISTITFRPLPSSLFFTIHQKPKLRSKPNPSVRSLFTGIVEEMGEIEHLGFARDGGFHMKINAKACLQNLNLGDSFCEWHVNLERALLPSTRMGGHFVQGHVDGIGVIESMEPEGDSLWIKVKTSPEILKYILPKGFIAVDGTSLTVVKVFDGEMCFNFMLVAYSQQKVVIPLKKVGMKVNLEVDILGKYVERLLSSGSFGWFIASS
ncbi:Lumazine-binding domain [Dillenia turbinata]|uniref:Riboflavin synthase n=1 Tax=Dillenia turbinata TaxID=194707 RepID=A0AAN8UP98_9MAGN